MKKKKMMITTLKKSFSQVRGRHKVQAVTVAQTVRHENDEARIKRFTSDKSDEFLAPHHVQRFFSKMAS